MVGRLTMRAGLQGDEPSPLSDNSWYAFCNTLTVVIDAGVRVVSTSTRTSYYLWYRLLSYRLVQSRLTQSILFYYSSLYSFLKQCILVSS
jgi:hypothetical protein